jgi:F0F1-type ATP synthase assembly protein I
LERAIKEASRPFLDGWITETIYAHKVCYTTDRQKEEEDLLKKEQLALQRVKRDRSKVLKEDKAERSRRTIGLAIASGLVVGIVFGSFGGVIFNWIFNFGFSWQSTALFGFGFGFILTIVGFLMVSLFK